MRASGSSGESWDRPPRPSGQGGFLLPSGYLHTRGAQIVDCEDHPVRIASVGWSGDDGTRFAPRGLYAVNYQATMRGLVSDGFNTIRIPWNDLLLTQHAVPEAGTIDYTLNPDLEALTGIQVDPQAGSAGHHRSDGGSPSSAQRLGGSLSLKTAYTVL